MATRQQKKMMGLAAAGAAGLGLYFLFTKSSSAATAPVVGPQPEPPSTPKPSRPPGNPPPYGAGCHNGQYDASFWNTRQSILDAFDFLGYATPTDRDTMNKLGADNALGGGDDVSNPEVTRFQKDYNKVSRGKKFAPNMGGLDEDGLVGPCTLNGMKYVLDQLGENGNWKQIVQGS